MNADIKEKVAVDSINNWLNDSLYVKDIEDFYLAYGKIFDCGIQNNLKSGVLDIYGINYYEPKLIEKLIDKILADTPKDYEILIDWLNKAKKYNGFYILGIQADRIGGVPLMCITEKMNVRLREMNTSEFQLFKKYSIEDYSKNLMKNSEMSLEEAMLQSEKEFTEMVTEGVDIMFGNIM